MKVITICNQKGGVGKTTTTLCLGEILESKGYKVLYIDLDKQCNTSTTLNADINKKGAYDILVNRLSAIDVIQVNEEEQCIISANYNMNNVDSELNRAENSSYKDLRLKASLKSAKEYFDFVIIDTPPNLNISTINALNCSDYLVIVSNADIYSLDGINFLLKICETLKHDSEEQGIDFKLKIGGVLLNKYNGRAIFNKDLKAILDDLAKENGIKTYNTTIRESIAIKESQGLKKNILKYAPKCNAVIDYMAFTEEVLADLNEG